MWCINDIVLSIRKITFIISRRKNVQKKRLDNRLLAFLFFFWCEWVRQKTLETFCCPLKRNFLLTKSIFLRSGRQWLFGGLSVFLTGFFFFHVKRCEIGLGTHFNIYMYKLKGQLNFAPLLCYQLIDKEITLKLITSCYTIGPVHIRQTINLVAVCRLMGSFLAYRFTQCRGI